MDSGYFDYAIGHPNAHGVSIHRDRLDNFLSYADRILADVDFNENVYEVDLIINGENPNLSDIIFITREIYQKFGDKEWKNH